MRISPRIMLALALVGCGEDVPLGVAFGTTTDAATDVGTDGFVDGAYTLTFDASVTAQCNGTLAGSESTFEAQSLADLGLLDKPVTLTRISDVLVRISGAGLLSSFNQTSVDLDRTSVASGGVYEWYVIVDDDFPLGPMGTPQRQRSLTFPEPMASPPRATARLRYVSMSQTSSCDLFVPVRLVP